MDFIFTVIGNSLKTITKFTVEPITNDIVSCTAPSMKRNDRRAPKARLLMFT